MKNELEKAIRAGEVCLRDIDAALAELRSAKGLGIADILGGGFFTSMFKCSSINEVERVLKKLDLHLEAFESYIRDVYHFQRTEPLFSDFDHVMDVFLDNIFSDMNTQVKMNELTNQLKDLKQEVNKIITKLQSHASTLD